MENFERPIIPPLFLDVGGIRVGYFDPFQNIQKITGRGYIGKHLVLTFRLFQEIPIQSQFLMFKRTSEFGLIKWSRYQQNSLTSG